MEKRLNMKNAEAYSLRQAKLDNPDRNCVAASLSAATQFLSGLSNFAWRSEYASAFFMLSLFSIALFVVDLLLEANRQEYPFATTSYALRTGLATIALILLALLSGNSLNAFVYFRF